MLMYVVGELNVVVVSAVDELNEGNVGNAN